MATTSVHLTQHYQQYFRDCNVRVVPVAEREKNRGKFEYYGYGCLEDYFRATLGIPAPREKQNGDDIVLFDDDDASQDGDLEFGDASARYKSEQYKMARVKRLAYQGDLIDRSATKEMFGTVAERIRKAIETLRATFGEDAERIMGDCIDDCERMVGGFLE